MQKTDSQLSGNLYRKGSTSSSPWNYHYVNVQISTGVMKFFVNKDGENVMQSQVNVKKGKLTPLDDSVGRFFAFEIFIEELIGKSGNARMTLAAENQSDFELWKEGFELCFSTPEKKPASRRSSSITAPPAPAVKPTVPPAPPGTPGALGGGPPKMPGTPGAPGGGPPPMPKMPGAPATPGGGPPPIPKMPGAPATPGGGPPPMPKMPGAPPAKPAAAPTMTKSSPARPTMPTRTGSQSEIVVETPKAVESIVESTHPTPAANINNTTTSTTIEPTPATRTVTPPPSVSRSLSPPPPAVPRSTAPAPAVAESQNSKPIVATRSLSPPTPAAPAPTTSESHNKPVIDARSVSPPPPAAPKADSTPVATEVPTKLPTPQTKSPVASPVPVKATSPEPKVVVTTPAIDPVHETRTKEEADEKARADLRAVRTKSITIAPFSSIPQQQPQERVRKNSLDDSPASRLFQNIDNNSSSDNISNNNDYDDDDVNTDRHAVRASAVSDPAAIRTSPESIESDYSDDVSDFDPKTSSLERTKTVGATKQHTPMSISTADEISVSGPSTISPGEVRKTVQSAPPYDPNSPTPASPFASQPTTPNSALAKIQASANKYKTPKFKNLLNSNGIDVNAEKEKSTPLVAPKRSAADLNRIAAEEEALLPPIVYKKIRTSLRRRELNINVRPTENVRMGYLAKLDSTARHLDEDSWMSQFVSFNIQTGIFTHFAEINGRRIARGKYDMNAIDIYTIDQVYHGKLFTFKLTRPVTDEKGVTTDELLAAFAAEDLQMLNYWLISFEDCAIELERLAEVKRTNSDKQLSKQNSKNLSVEIESPEKPVEVPSPAKMASPVVAPKNSVKNVIKALARAPSFHFPKSESPIPDHEPIEAAIVAKKSSLKQSLKSISRDSGDEQSPPKKNEVVVKPVEPAVAVPPASTAPIVVPPAAHVAPHAEPRVGPIRRPSVHNIQVTSAPATPLGTDDHKQFVELDLPNTFNALTKQGSANQSMFGEPIKVVDLDDLDRSLGLDNMSSIVSPISSAPQRPSITRVPSVKPAAITAATPAAPTTSTAAPLGIAGIGAAAAAAAAAMAARVKPVVAPVEPAISTNIGAPAVVHNIATASQPAHPATTTASPATVTVVAVPPKVLHSDVLGMKFEVQSVKYPAARLARRIKIWYCSSGFSLATEEAVRQFVHELKHTGDDTLKSFADEKFDNILDWANLLEVLRKYEVKLRLESPAEQVEDQFVVCKVAVTVPSRTSGQPHIIELSENVTIAQFAEMLAKEFKLPLEDLLTHLPVLFTKTSNPHQQSLNLLRDDLTFAEDLILYQEEVIDHLWDSYSVIKNLVEQRDDVINQLYSQISDLKERQQLTLRDDMFNGGLSGSPTNSGAPSGTRLQYSESPARFSTFSNNSNNYGTQSEEGDVTISRDEWRSWIEEKQKLILQHNEAKASLVNEIRLLRKSLNPSTEQTYLELKKSESARARLEEELVKAQIQNDSVKTELAVCKQQLIESESEKMMMESDWMERLNNLAAQYEEKLVQQFADHQQELAQRSYFAAENSYLQPELQNDLTENSYYLPQVSTIDHDATNNTQTGYNFSMEMRQEVPNGNDFNASGYSYNGDNGPTLQSLLQSNSFNASNNSNGNRTPPSTVPNSTRNSINIQNKSQWIQQYAESHALLGSSPTQIDDFRSQYRAYSNQGIVPPEMDQDLMDLSMYRAEYNAADGQDNNSLSTGSISRRASTATTAAGGNGSAGAVNSPQENINSNIRPRSSSNDLRGYSDNKVKTLPQATTVASANSKLSRANPSPSNKIARQPDSVTYDMTQNDLTTYVKRDTIPTISEHPLRAAFRNDTINRLGGQNKALPKTTRPQFPFTPRNDAVKQAQQKQLRQQEALRAQPGILPAPISRAISPSNRAKVASSPHKYLENTDSWKNRFNSEKEYVNPHIVDRHSGGWKFT